MRRGSGWGAARASQAPPLAEDLGDHVPELRVALVARLHVLQPRRTVLTDDGHVARADPVGVPELALERAAGQLELGLEAGAPRLERELEAGAGTLWLGQRHEQVDQVGARRRLARGEEHPLDAGCPPDARGGWPVEQPNPAVVTTAAAHTRLGAEPIARELPQGAGVIV